MSRDPHILTGIDAIINPENIRPDIDLKQLELSMINGGLISQKTKEEPADAFLKELNDAASKIGLSLGDFKSEPKTETPAFAMDSRVEPIERRFNITSPTPPEQQYSELRNITHEQERRAHIGSILGTSSSGGASEFSFEREKQEDCKCAMLAEIDSLMSMLQEVDIDVSRVPRVTKNDTFDEIESVLKLLRHKNDHSRYCSFAEEMLLFAAHGLEELFNGKRTWFGYNPDLTGWNTHLTVKLRRMKYDTSQIVSSTLKSNEISAPMRIALELLPSMFLYTKLNKQQHNKPGVRFNDKDMSDSLGGLNNA